MIENFSLERMGKTAAGFNQEKLDWMNGVYIRGMAVDDFARHALPFLEKGLPPEIKRPLDIRYVSKIAPLVQERTKRLTEVPALTTFFFKEELTYDTATLVAKNMTPESTLNALKVSLEKAIGLAVFDEASLETLFRPLAEQIGLKAGQLFSVLRTAVTGEIATPPLFQTMVVLGRERCLKRIAAAVEKLQK